jgi:PTS system nitrogen regulatory IIA component
MQLTMRELSQLLNISESTTLKWIKQRGLPVEHSRGRYHFNRTELLEWATANQVRVCIERFENFSEESEAGPSLVEALEAGGIHYNLRDSTKELALQALVDVLPLPEGVDREFILRLFLAREACASTAVGDGIALPHARNPIVLEVSRPMITLCFLQKPVDFGALDGKPVQVLFSLICPTVRGHLRLLARLSSALHDGEFRGVVLRQGRPEEILREARRVESHMAAKTSQPAASATLQEAMP